MLAAAGVLKLVDEDVVDAVGDGDGGVGGLAVGVFKDGEGDLRDFNVVDCAGLREDDFKLADGVAEEGEAGADDLPVFVGVAGGGQEADGGEGGFEAGDGGESGNEVEDLSLFALAVGWKAEALIDLLAKAAVEGEDEIGEADEGLACLVERVWVSEVCGGKVGELCEGLEARGCALFAGETG